MVNIMVTFATLLISLLLTVQAGKTFENDTSIKGIIPKEVVVIGNRTYYISPAASKLFLKESREFQFMSILSGICWTFIFSLYSRPTHCFHCVCSVNVLDAVSLCMDFGLHLISLETAEEITLVTNYLRTIDLPAKIDHWTSGRELLGSFQWTGSSKLFTDTNWHSSQPDGLACDCVYMHEGDLWHDQPCSYEKSFICEQPY